MSTRAQRLQALLPQEDNGMPVDGALIVSGANRRYLTGFPSSAGYVLVTREQAWFLVDFRYYEAASKNATGCQVVMFHRVEDTLAQLIKEHHIRGVLFESEGMTLAQAAWMEQILASQGAQAVKTGTLDSLLWQLRMYKTQEEIACIKEAQRITEEAFEQVLPLIHEGVTERELALQIEMGMRRRGAEGVAFDLIVVAGAKGSLCHGVPDDNQVHRGDFITMDIGARVNGYNSDMTRTVALGHVSEEQRKVYNIVLQAQQLGIAAAKPGAVCGDVDKVVRDYIYNAGYEGYFGHGTGHAVGLEIHESPRFSIGMKTVLAPGMVMTVEPGIYLPDRFGVRIEDMVAITEDGCEDLTNEPKELIEL